MKRREWINVDCKKFSEFKTGKVVPLEDVKGHWAFVPNPLPPKWTMPERLWLLIGEARQRVGDLNGSGNNLSNPSLLIRPLQRREAMRSSSLEGTYATPRELLLFEKALKDSEARTESDQQNQWREVNNYFRTIGFGYERIKQGHALNCNLFCELHRMLMRGVRGAEKNPGEIRKTQVHVGVDWRFTPPPPGEVQQCIAELEAFHVATNAYDPLVQAFLAHYQFEAIHPFTDGNGRIGRVLLSLTIARLLNLAHPWLYLSEFFENHRSDYINSLFRVSTHGEWDEWVELCAHATIEQATLAIARCSALESLKEEYKETVRGLNSRLHLIIDKLFEEPFLSVVEVRDYLQVSYPTARNDMAKLQELGIVGAEEDEYPKMYCADRILQITYVN